MPSEEAQLFRPDSYSLRARLMQPSFPDDLVLSRRLSIGFRGITLHHQEQSMIGTVKFFNTQKGFGFIAPDGGSKDVFVHATAVEAAGMRQLAEGQRVSFEVQPDARGSKAVNLKAA